MSRRKYLKYGQMALWTAALVPLATAAIVKAPEPATLFQEVRALENGGGLLPGSHLWMYGSRMVDYYTIDRANTIAIKAAAKGVGHVKRFPAGSLYIKENFDDHKVLKTVTAMLKVPGYDNADRDWLMAAYKPDGKVIAYGRVQSCISCHALARQTDFTFPPLTRLPIVTVQSFFPHQVISPQYRALLAKEAH
ncbi:MAG: cytochrome P460 family protein [Acidiferrobacter sp.]